MNIVFLIIIVLVVLALVLWAVEKLPMIQQPIKLLIEALVILLAAWFIASKAGLL